MGGKLRAVQVLEHMAVVDAHMPLEAVHVQAEELKELVGAGRNSVARRKELRITAGADRQEPQG